MAAQKIVKRTSKRLDGKKILLSLTAQMEKDIRQYCRDNKIESENEFIRQAIVKYLDSDYDSDTLKLSSLKTVQEQLTKLFDMISLLWRYQHMIHLSLLSYHPELAPEVKDAAFASAITRHEKLFSVFQDQLRDDPPFFEKLLHTYVTGDLDG